MKPKFNKPTTLAAVADQADSLESFGLLLRDWIHVVLREDISNRPALARAIHHAPCRLASRLPRGDIADAYLAAYAEWIADRAGIERPRWTKQKERAASEPWFSGSHHAILLLEAPASFRQRGIFTVPDDVVRIRRGRPKVSERHKREKARERDRRYRAKIRELLAQARVRQAG